MAVYTSEWRDTDQPDRPRAQIFSGPRGLCYAIESARRAAADGTTLWDRVTDAATGETVFDSQAGIDKGDWCPRCTVRGWCKDPSAHFVHESGQADTQWYPRGV
jgi:hypothetical protein